jgi:hypothetical protein
MKRKPIQKSNTILEVLKNSKEPLLIREVWIKSEYKNDIKSFYEALKTHVAKGEIAEMTRNGKQSQLKFIQPEVAMEKAFVPHLRVMISMSIFIAKLHSSLIFTLRSINFSPKSGKIPQTI